MQEYRTYIAKHWNVSESIASQLCDHFEAGDSFYFISDYAVAICTELEVSIVAEIHDWLTQINELAPKKKRLLNALKKANALTDTVERRIQFSTNGLELDDMLLPFRFNPRSRAQIAQSKGLGSLAETIFLQEIEDSTIEELAQEYVGKDESLASAEDVISGVKEILIDRLASDETVRTMVRDMGFEDGFFEVIPRTKKEKRFNAYRGKMIKAHELPSEEFLMLLDAENKKEIRFKHTMQLFHISEFLRHHFITNPDSTGYDFLCEIIDEVWARTLQPLVEAHVKEFMLGKAEEWALHIIDQEFLKKELESRETASTVVMGRFTDKNLTVVIFNAKGDLLGAAQEELKPGDAGAQSQKLKGFYNRFKPARILIYNHDDTPVLETIVKRSLGVATEFVRIEKVDLPENIQSFLTSPWMQEQCSVMDDHMKQLYGLGLLHTKPINLIPKVGVQFFSIHQYQSYIKPQKLHDLINRRITEKELHKGVPFLDAPESVLIHIPGITEELLISIRKEGIKNPYSCKDDLLRVEGITATIFRNIAGYIIIPTSLNPLDRTLVHPEFFEKVFDYADELGLSIESIIADPESIRAAQTEDPSQKVYIAKKLVEQLRVGQNYPLSESANISRRRATFPELKEGAVVQGKVTNITKFGVFVDINAVCEGLIHISQLADEYIETPDQVVKENDRVSVRILKIDPKKRRISLSMKKLGNQGPRVRPSKGQLTDLAKHFKNR